MDITNIKKEKVSTRRKKRRALIAEELYNQGELTGREISTKLGIDPATFYNYLNLLNVARQPRKVRQAQKAKDNIKEQ
jgi:hypothetical protein